MYRRSSGGDGLIDMTDISSRAKRYADPLYIVNICY